MIPLIAAIVVLLGIAAISDERDGQDSALIDVVIFVLCLGGILYKHHKARQDDEY